MRNPADSFRRSLPVAVLAAALVSGIAAASGAPTPTAPARRAPRVPSSQTRAASQSTVLRETSPPHPHTPTPPYDDAFFESSIRPLLLERCISCHGPKLQQGGLRLDTAEGLAKGGSDGAVIQPGDPDGSLLIRAVWYQGSVRMPPSGKLPLAQIAALERWVKAGAPWPKTPEALPGKDDPKRFWSFQPVRAPAIPAVKDRVWIRSPVDAFVLAKLEEKGLAPAPPADRRTLIRRATYDLTGLPPTPAQVDAFLRDRAPGAFARVIDRLLASPRFGECWGRHWLDLVRYCDSFDSRILGEKNPGNIMDATEAWRYRDWVVRALNRDEPYDRFIIDQIAGDIAHTGSELADGTIATGMLAIGNWGGGDADKEKLLTDIADDQVDVVSRVFMGLTVGCARCHDHKFDPIPTKDYYGLAGIFFSTHILKDVGPKTNGPPMLRIPLETPEQAAARARWMAREKDLGKRLTSGTTDAYTRLAAALAPQTARYLRAALEVRQGAGTPDTIAGREGLQPFAVRQMVAYLGVPEPKLLTNAVREVSGIPGVFAWRGSGDCPNAVINTTPNLAILGTPRLPPRSVTIHPGPNAGVGASWTSPIAGRVRISGHVQDADPAGGDGIAWTISRVSGFRSEVLARGDIPNGGAQPFEPGSGALAEVTVAPGDRILLSVLPKADYTCDTTAVEVKLERLDAPSAWSLTDDLLVDPLRSNPHPDQQGHLDTWRFVDLQETPGGHADGASIEALAHVDPARDAATVDRIAKVLGARFAAAPQESPFGIRSAADESALPTDTRASLAGIRAELMELRSHPLPPVAYANGAQEGGVPESPQAGLHDVRVHIRGRYDRLGDMVPRHFPVILAGEHQPPIREGSGRLQLAKWLAGSSHPLTARVMVNRLWQHLFGAGIVRTPSNFGKLGERPTHPELLDYLAVRFVRNGWSVKRMLREMMLTSTYQQSSVPSDAALKLDPDNRLFSRMARKRLEAEEVRDTLLAVSGRLDPRMGGPATQSFDDPRRTLYQMTVRSDKSGFGPLFDQANSDASVDVRTVSTVAPQALFLLNHPFVLAQAKALAERVEKEAPDTRGRVRRLYELLYARLPNAREAEIGLAFLTREAKRPGAKGQSGWQNAWEEYAELLLCADELMYVD